MRSEDQRSSNFGVWRSQLKPGMQEMCLCEQHCVAESSYLCKCLLSSIVKLISASLPRVNEATMSAVTTLLARLRHRPRRDAELLGTYLLHALSTLGIAQRRSHYMWKVPISWTSMSDSSCIPLSDVSVLKACSRRLFVCYTLKYWT